MRYLALFVLALVLPTVGSLIIWGGWMMMQLRLRAVAAMAAVLALVPCQPVFILGPIFGIWSLVLLSRRQVKDGFLHSAELPPGKSSAGPAEELDESATKIGAGLAIGIGLGVAIGTAIDNLGAGIAIGVALGIAFGAAQSAASPAAQESPPPPKLDENFQRLIRSRLKVPAIGLLLVGAVNLAAALAVLLLPVLVRRSGAFDEGFGFVEGASTFAEATFVSVILACCSLASGITLMVGAARMLDLQSHSIALTAAVVAILPVALGFPLSLPLGIWALLVLSRRDVKAVFGSWSS